MLVILGAHSAIVDQKWTEQGREIKLIAIKMFKILIKNIQKNMIYVPIDPELLPIACQGVYNM